jgi:mRNA interferase MazF
MSPAFQNDEPMIASRPSYHASSHPRLACHVGEANLPKQSVVEVSKVSTVEKTQLGEYIGSLTEQRTYQILAGMRFLQRSFFTR